LNAQRGRGRGLRVASALSAIALICSGPVLGQSKKDELPEDPYLKGEEAAMKAAGYTAFGSFPWAGEVMTGSIDQVIGEERMIWLETEHFRLGMGLEERKLPSDPKDRRLIQADLKELRKSIPKIKTKPRRMDPWLLAHLYAFRLERLYDEFVDALAIEGDQFASKEALEKGLSMSGRQHVLIFEKESDLGRYFGRFTDTRRDQPSRWYFDDGSFLIATSAESFDEALQNDTALHCNIVFNQVHNFLDVYRGYFWDFPQWFENGMAQYFMRKISKDWPNISLAEGQDTEIWKDPKWEPKIRKRVGFDHYPKAEELTAITDPADMDFVAYMMSWSRVDFLMRDKAYPVGRFLYRMKDCPRPEGMMPKEILLGHQKAMLQEVLEMDYAGFDEAWSSWVKKRYKKK
jgi:hypothetical protein